MCTKEYEKLRSQITNIMELKRQGTRSMWTGSSILKTDTSPVADTQCDDDNEG